MVSEGYGFVTPRSSDTARTLLEIAERLRLEPWVVRTTAGGYIVPDAVARQYEGTLGAPSEDPPVDEEEPSEEGPSGEPDESWKNADIKEWASAHQVDLGDATKKADMLAAIRTADKEE